MRELEIFNALSTASANADNTRTTKEPRTTSANEPKEPQKLGNGASYSATNIANTRKVFVTLFSKNECCNPCYICSGSSVNSISNNAISNNIKNTSSAHRSSKYLQTMQTKSQTTSKKYALASVNCHYLHFCYYTSYTNHSLVCSHIVSTSSLSSLQRKPA